MYLAATAGAFLGNKAFELFVDNPSNRERLPSGAIGAILGFAALKIVSKKIRPLLNVELDGEPLGDEHSREEG